MVRPKLIAVHPITMAELKHDLDAIKKKNNDELSFRAAKTEEYLNQFSKVSAKDAEAIRKKLDSLSIARLKEDLVIKIIDLLPANIEEVKTILQSSTANLSKKDMESIVGVTSEFAPSAKK